MARVLITGSTTGLGLVAARELIYQGHAVVLHARNQQRADDVAGLLDGAACVLIGDLSELGQIKALAAEMNTMVPLDAIIHNAGLYPTGPRQDTADGLPAVLTVKFSLRICSPCSSAGRRVTCFSAATCTRPEAFHRAISRGPGGTGTELRPTAIASCMSPRWPWALHVGGPMS